MLGRIVQLEFLAVASGTVLMFPLFIPAETVVGKTIKRVSFVALGWTFAVAAYEFYGFGRVFSYCVLVFVSYDSNALFEWDGKTV